MKFEYGNTPTTPKQDYNVFKSRIVRVILSVPMLVALQVIALIPPDEFHIYNALFYVVFIPFLFGLLTYFVSMLMRFRQIFLPAYVMMGTTMILLLLAPSTFAGKLVPPTWCGVTMVITEPDPYYIKNAEGHIIVNPEQSKLRSVRYCVNESAYWNIVGDKLPDPILD
jgi:hypothetical protein